MHILVINPNTTASMTEKIGAAARQAVGGGTKITAVNPTVGPPAIQGAKDGEAALPGLFALFDAKLAADSTIDAVVIACFDDTGLWELRARSRVPVVGIGEAAYHMASLRSHTFSVVTTLADSVPVLEANIKKTGFSDRCTSVRASGVPVLALEEDGDDARRSIAAQIEQAIRTDGAGAIALGCAGMADLAADFAVQFDCPVIDGVAAAVRLAEALHGMAQIAPAKDFRHKIMSS